MDVIDALEQKGRVFVIRPQTACVSRTDRDIERLEAFYEHGYNYMKENFEAMQAWLSRAETLA